MQIGPYAVINEVGHGGFGVVYKATDSRDGQIVAIKMILKMAPQGTSISPLSTYRQVKDDPTKVEERERARIALVREASETSRLTWIIHDLSGEKRKDALKG